MEDKDRIRAEKLLGKLDDEINIKCIELKEEKTIRKEKNIFFISCLTFILIFFLQLFFSIIKVNYLIILFVYQIIATIIAIGILFNPSKGGWKKWKSLN